MSISGGLPVALARLRELGGEAMQIFTRNQRQWKVVPIEPGMADLFRRKWEESGRVVVAAHGTHLVNLAEADPVKAERSIYAFADELRRAHMLGIPFLVTHPGYHLGYGIEAGLNRFVQNLDRSLALCPDPAVMVLIENTAGQGTSLGSSFEEIAYILDSSRWSERLGVCFDTCHSFAAGYDIRNPEAYRETFSLFAGRIGLDRLKFFHLNDSKKGLGSRIDRHEHIGEGEIGPEGFRLLLNDARFSAHPMVLETPKGKDLSYDRKNLEVLRSLICSKPEKK